VKPRAAVLAADEALPVVDAIAAALEGQGFEVVREPVGTWGPTARVAAERVARGEVAFGVVCCWTGTGVTMIANKVPGVRAALCVDAATAAGARRWNDANVLGISMRLTTPAVASEIVEAWARTPYDGTEGESLACAADLDGAGRTESR
jgi:ribose 5-phosphate isomerase B